MGWWYLAGFLAVAGGTVWLLGRLFARDDVGRFAALDTLTPCPDCGARAVTGQECVSCGRTWPTDTL